jgi:hypothetical protein
MFRINGDKVFEVEITETPNQVVSIEKLIGCEIITEELKDEQGNIIDLKTYKFNTDKGEYEEVIE